MEIKLIAADLDDTLLRRDKTISEFTKSVFERCRERGILTAFATARFEIGCQRYADELNPDIVITADGALSKYKGAALYSSPLETSIANGIISELMEHNEPSVVAAFNGGCYWNNRNVPESSVLHKSVYNDFSAPLSVPVLKILVETDNEALVRQIAGRYGQIRIVPYLGKSRHDFINPLYLGEARYAFVNPNTTKLNAIKGTCDFFNIDFSEVAAFGDDYNDIEMLKNCGIGVAVENAISEVKSAADYTALDCDADGVAHWIEEHILNLA
ncbi:MAG: Cof-type HAD-IIB family hydrolase [Oscillospiraceae bacterium]|jgi:Cof subfamily protein (haloacid dehalogenase superfamily)|nr:Cof-type HAD-IIB family hydrolase [Oscillospiraceae bacterium]